MTDQVLIDIIREAIELVLLVSGPVLVVGLVVGVTVSVLQVMTSVQDATLSFVPRIVAMLLTSFLLLSWMLEKVVGFSARLLSQFSAYVG